MKLLAFLDKAFSHPVVTAFLGAALALGATYWLDLQADKRETRRELEGDIQQVYQSALRLEFVAAELLGMRQAGPSDGPLDSWQIEDQRKQLQGFYSDLTSRSIALGLKLEGWLISSPARAQDISSVLALDESGLRKTFGTPDGTAYELIVTHVITPYAILYDCALVQSNNHRKGFPLLKAGEDGDNLSLGDCVSPIDGAVFTRTSLTEWVRNCRFATQSLLSNVLRPQPEVRSYPLSHCRGPQT